jgi:hypothetical protein
VLADLARRVTKIRTLLPDLDLRLRRTPDRCVVQAGRVGLSVSWLPSPRSPLADGTLLVIEWDGTVTLPGERASPAVRRAAPVCEEVLRLDVGSAADVGGSPQWRWRCTEGVAMRAYTSQGLAGQCMQRVLQRVRGAMAAEA